MTSQNGARRYRLISADSHVNEPGDLWTKRVPAAFRDRAPRIERFDEWDAWIVEGIKEPVKFGWTSCAGLEPEEMKAGVRFDEMRRGGYDSAVRVKEQDRDGVDAEVMYPTPLLAIAMCAHAEEDYHLAMVRAYNDWISEYVSYAPERFAGMALLPNRGGQRATLAEIDRVLDRPGMRGVVLGAYPNGTLSIEPEDDLVWAALAERNLPITIHVALATSIPKVAKSKLPGYGRFFDAPNRMIEMIFSGMFDRYPSLNVFFAEVDCGWVPDVKEQIDNNYNRLEPTTRFGLKQAPGRYIERHFHFGYMTDTFGLKSRRHIGAERILWSSDYPHISADWPYSWRTIQASMSGISPEERSLITHGNAERLFGFA
jgi:predicted TIM-barrel fold metal-dependent hydrolase